MALVMEEERRGRRRVRDWDQRGKRDKGKGAREGRDRGIR